MLKFDEPTFTEGFTITKIRTILDSSFAGKDIWLDGLKNMTNNTWFEIINQSGRSVRILTKNVPILSSGLSPDSEPFYYPSTAFISLSNKGTTKIFFRDSESRAFYAVTQQIF